MRRYLVLLLVLILLIPCMAVPASASTYADVVKELKNLQAGLGDSQRFILDAIERIEEALYDLYSLCDTGINSALQWFTDEFAILLGDWFPSVKTNLNNIYNRVNYIYSYFFVSNAKMTEYQLKLQSNGKWTIVNVPGIINVSCTGMQADLSYIHFQIIQGLANILNEFYSLFKGDVTASDDFEEGKEPLETQVDEWLEELETAPTISLDDIEAEFDKVTDFQPDTNYTAVLASIFLNEAFATMFVWCIILAMAGFILYGKR